MKVKLYVFSIVLICIWAGLFAVGREKPLLARLHYDGGGDWYNDPDMLPNLAQFVNRQLGTDFASDQAVVKPDADNLFDYPFVFMTGHGNVVFSDSEIDNIRRWFEHGGFLYVDDDYGMDESFRREIKRIFPDRSLTELPATHPIFHCFYGFPEGLPKIHEHDGNRPQALAIFDDTGRMMVLYTYESNISDGWASPRIHDNPPEVRQKALQMGANILYYLIARQEQ